jgi:hypothetical protein
MRHADVFQFHMHSIEKCQETDRMTGLYVSAKNNDDG